MRTSERKIERLTSIRVFVQQESEIGRVLARGRNCQKHELSREQEVACVS
jgi:hypothetical protein